MQVAVKPQTINNTASIYDMRYSGATLRQIADKIGRTQERIRQILIDNYGSTKHKLVSTTQLCKLSGLSWNRVMELCQGNVITPVREWETGSGRRLLWPQATVEQIRLYFKLKAIRTCRICHSPVPLGKRRYCSEQCYKESQKYKYRSFEARQRHRANMKRYKEAHHKTGKSLLSLNKQTRHAILRARLGEPHWEGTFCSRGRKDNCNRMC